MFAGSRKRGMLAGALLALAIIGGGAGAGFVIAGSGEDDRPVTGTALQECTAAALQHAGGGTVTETEVGDDGAAYEVEVRREDGSEVEVNLDEGCRVIGAEGDDDDAGENETGEDED